MRNLVRRLVKPLLTLVCCFFLPVACMVATHHTGEAAAYRQGNRYGSSGQAPPVDTPDAVIQVYAARAARWRGAFGVHTWVTTKRSDEQHYERLEVIGYRVYWGGRAVQVRRSSPDAMWYGNYPTLLREIRGDQRVDELIDQLHTAAQSYPYDEVYHVWPGPNSNTFTAHLGRQVNELKLELPSNAIGKDYLGSSLAGLSPSGTGVQISLMGYAGVMAGLEEGIEVNILGLSAGIDFLPPAIKLPGVGRLGFADRSFTGSRVMRTDATR